MSQSSDQIATFPPSIAAGLDAISTLSREDAKWVRASLQMIRGQILSELSCLQGASKIDSPSTLHFLREEIVRYSVLIERCEVLSGTAERPRSAPLKDKTAEKLFKRKDAEGEGACGFDRV